MKEAGYELFECHSEEDIQLFKKYYIPREQLCTFHGRRLKSCYVFFAIKKGADKLKRENYENPVREDEYGISVISIQFSRDNYTLSIKNRYNHTVKNPDATFGNNLENIISGLTNSFERKYGYKIKQNNEGYFEIPGYTQVNGKYYKYNYEIENIYYCPNNIIIIDGKMIQYPQEQYIVMDYFLLDIKNKKLSLIDERLCDGLVEVYKSIKNIEIKKEQNKKRIIITISDGTKSIITLNNQNQIIEYENTEIQELDEDFMGENETLEQINLPKLKIMKTACFGTTEKLKKINLPKLYKMEKYCFQECNEVEFLNLSSLETIEKSCFEEVRKLKELSIPKLIYMGDNCFNIAPKIEKITLPKLTKMGDSCFTNCQALVTIECPKLESMGFACFKNIESIKELEFPELQIMDSRCFAFDGNAKKFIFPKLKIMNHYCFLATEEIEELFFPNLEVVGTDCFKNAKYNTSFLQNFSLPKLKECRSENIEQILRNTRHIEKNNQLGKGHK